jgi:hypothetical protein
MTDGQWQSLREMVARRPELVLLLGSSRLPGGVPSHSQYERLGVILVVERDSGRIVAADSTLLTELARAFFRGLVEGLSVGEDGQTMLARLDDRYLGQSGAALAAALKHCMEIYARA